MSEPPTALDDRFSEPGAAPTSWDDTMRTLETTELFSDHNRPRWP